MRSWRVGAVGARLPARLPEHLVAGEEGEVDAGVARGLDGRALRGRPVLVVPARHEDLVVLQQRWVAADVRARGVAHVVAVALEEADHRVLGAGEEPRAAAVVLGRVEGPVVGDLVGGLVGGGIAGRAGHRALVEAVAAVGVVGLPGRVGGLQQDVRVARVVAHDEHDLAVAARVVADEMGDVHARDRGARHGPRPRHGPVAAVDEPGGRRRSGTRAGSTSRSAPGSRRSAAPRRRSGSSRAGGCRCGSSSVDDLILNEIVWPLLTLIDVA